MGSTKDDWDVRWERKLVKLEKDVDANNLPARLAGAAAWYGDTAVKRMAAAQVALDAARLRIVEGGAGWKEAALGNIRYALRMVTQAGVRSGPICTKVEAPALSVPPLPGDQGTLPGGGKGGAPRTVARAALATGGSARLCKPPKPPGS